MLAELRGVLTGLAIAAAPALLVVILGYDLPVQDLLGSVRFHLAALVGILALMLLLSRAWRRALLVLGLAVASVVQGAALLLQQQERRLPYETQQVATSLDILSFNVLNDNPTRDDAARYVAGSGADVVVLMEAIGLGRGALRELAKTYPYQLGCEQHQPCGVAIFSRTPLSAPQKYRQPSTDRERLLKASTTIDGKVITIVALHLTKPYFDYFSQSEQQQASTVIGEIDGPVLLVGDFNAAAWSRNISGMADGLGLVPPPQYPATWPVELGPLGVPIDNMFTLGPALIRDISATPEAYGSNHLGLLATVDLF